jgi:hypothetical protein
MGKSMDKESAIIRTERNNMKKTFSMENSMVKLLDLMRTGKKVMKENMSMGS